MLIYLYIGGASEAEVGERKDRATHALNVARAVVKEGILPEAAKEEGKDESQKKKAKLESTDSQAHVEMAEEPTKMKKMKMKDGTHAAELANEDRNAAAELEEEPSKKEKKKKRKQAEED
ncbi:60 kDa heat shock protein [Canna indica]|uniref:60 kDa heat shock protein n=1 Tax=Canna indica TaxID=4628 RepID=A0AAQ3JX98_9LILI|nr:60 kDa heat shock protein [Canna indica]